MQKLITITINLGKLQESSKGVFTLTDVEEINEMLEDGWRVEEWKFVTGEKEAEKAVLLVVLNDAGADLLDRDDKLEDNENEDNSTNKTDSEDEGESVIRYSQL